MSKSNNLDNLRHSTAHLLAAAVTSIWPDVLPTIGPSISDGFYYDFDFGKINVSDKDLSKIEGKMKQIVKNWDKFTKEEVSETKAKAQYKNNKYKKELIDDLVHEKENISLYKSGDFVDLCKGGHVANPSDEIKHFKLLSIAGAYWRGNEKNKMLTRIYGTVFPTKKELDDHLAMIEKAKDNDHRTLNRVLKLYQANDLLGQGLVTLLPNGTIIAKELEDWAQDTERKWGYQQVLSPQIATESLFKISGHVPYYLDSMYPPMHLEEKGKGEKEVYYLRPMNCAHHHLVYKDVPRSYRDLPLRISEYGTVYRYERSGEIHGMMRVRGPIHQNDAHIFCTEDQAEEEFQKVMELHKYYYDLLGLSKKDYLLSFAIRDKNNKDKYLGDDALWEKAERIALKYIKSTNIPYEIEEGGAAFYGPKIDFNIKTVTGKVFGASTNQLDFFLPKAFKLTYTDKDGDEKTPVCIHRAPLGAHVRFVAFLTEHFGGAFPVWLSPVQVKVLPITSKNIDYSKQILETLLNEDIRATIDDRNETLQSKIRKAQIEKVPYMLIVGDKEENSKNIAVRLRDGSNLGQLELGKFIINIKDKISEKSLEL